MTNKRGIVKLFPFSFEIDAPNIAVLLKFSAVRLKFRQCAKKFTYGSKSAPKLKFKL